jgi:peptide-methionine (R)-S-oxide reductase
MKYLIIIALLGMMLQSSCQNSNNTDTSSTLSPPIELSEQEWRERLSPMAYQVLRLKETEPRGSGLYNHYRKEGYYLCAGCGDTLFVSSTKYDSGSGWPSFYDCIEGKINENTDKSHGMVRSEIVCKRCNGHLGHKFEDGPKPTGMRYCVNSVSLKFVPLEPNKKP